MHMRAAGGVCAVIAGALSGSMYAPARATRSGVDAVSFTVTFGCAAGAATYLLLLVYALLRCAAGRAPLAFHWRRALGPGLLSGALFALGNMAAAYVAAHLSQSVGVALTNCSLLVSSAWSVFYYKEVVDAARVRGWFLAALGTLVGIGMLGLSNPA